VNPEEFAKTHAQTFPAGKCWTVADFETYFARDMTVVGGDATSFVIGTALLDEAEILTVATAPERQRKGLARAALQDFISQCRARGVTCIFLEVADDNHPAIAFYTHTGFAQVGRRQGYYRRENGLSRDALIMQMILP